MLGYFIGPGHKLWWNAVDESCIIIAIKLWLYLIYFCTILNVNNGMQFNIIPPQSTKINNQQHKEIHKSTSLFLHLAFDASLGNINKRRHSFNSLATTCTELELIFGNTVEVSHHILAVLLELVAPAFIFFAHFLNFYVIGVECCVSTILPSSVFPLAFLCKSPFGLVLICVFSCSWNVGSWVSAKEIM